jgi:hypothetical protein
MPLTVNSIGQGSGNERTRHRANRPSLSGGQIAQATGLARATVKRLIRGDRRHKAKLAGLGWVRWDDGIKNNARVMARALTLPLKGGHSICP